MQSIKLYFIHPYSRFSKMIRAVLLIIGIAALTTTISKYQQLNSKSDALNLKIIYMEKNRQLVTHKHSSKDDPQLNDQILNAQKILNDLNMPWDESFLALEKSVNKDIIVMSVTPNSNKSGIVITGLSLEINDVLKFVSRLQNTGFFKQVYLNEQEVYDEHSIMQLKFKLTADWEQNQ